MNLICIKKPGHKSRYDILKIWWQLYTFLFVNSFISFPQTCDNILTYNKLTERIKVILHFYNI